MLVVSDECVGRWRRYRVMCFVFSLALYSQIIVRREALILLRRVESQVISRGIYSNKVYCNSIRQYLIKFSIIWQIHRKISSLLRNKSFDIFIIELKLRHWLESIKRLKISLLCYDSKALVKLNDGQNFNEMVIHVNNLSQHHWRSHRSIFSIALTIIRLLLTEFRLQSYY